MNIRIQELLHDLDSEIEDIRKTAVVWLAQLRDPSVLPHLEKMTSDPSPAVQYFARRAISDLREIATPNQAPPAPVPGAADVATLIGLLGHEDPETRVRAAMACYHRKHPDILAALLKTLEGERNVRVLATLVKAIGVYRSPDVTRRLLELLHHSDSRVRSNTVDACMFLDDPEVIDAISLLATDAANRVRSGVALFLAGRFPEKVEKIVTDMVESDLVWMKDSAIYVMQMLGADWCEPLLDRIATREGEHPALVEKATATLKWLRSRRNAVTPSSSATPSREIEGHLPVEAAPPPQEVEPEPGTARNPSIPEPARAETPSTTAAEIPSSTICGPNGAVGAEAAAQTVTAVPEISSEQSRDDALKAVNSPDPATRLEGIEKLKELGDESCRERLELATADVDRNVRVRARALLRALEMETQEALQMILLGNEAVKAQAAGSLAWEDHGGMLERVRQLGAKLDRGVRFSETLVQRDASLAALGRAIFADFQAGRLPDQSLSSACRQASEKLANLKRELEARVVTEAEEEAARSDLRQETRNDSHPTVPSAHGSRNTGRSQTLAQQIGRPTGRFQQPTDAPAASIRKRFRDYLFLFVPAALLVAVGAFVAYGVVERAIEWTWKSSDTKVAAMPVVFGTDRSVPTPLGIAEVVTSSSKTYAGRTVRWRGSVKDVVDERRRVVVSSGSYEFSAQFERSLGPKVAQGEDVDVDGVILDVVSSQVKLEGLRALPVDRGAYRKLMRDAH